MQNTGTDDLYILENRFMLSDRRVGDSIMNVFMKQFLLKILDGKADATPIFTLLQIFFSTMHKGKIWCFPTATIFVSINLSIHSDGAMG